MPETFSTQRMLALRKLTRAAAEQLRQQFRDVLTAVVPLMQARFALGDYVRGVKDSVRGADGLFRDIQAHYEKVAAEKPFGLRRDLTTPVDLRGSSVDLTPSEYQYTAKALGNEKPILITSPFRWVLSYTGYSPDQLRKLLAATSPSNEDIHGFILHGVTLQTLVMRQPALSNVFAALRYGLSVQKQPEFGELPLLCVTAPITTIRPPDEVIIETTELTGSNTFEEVIDLDALAALRDPLRDSLVELARSHGEPI